MIGRIPLVNDPVISDDKQTFRRLRQTLLECGELRWTDSVPVRVVGAPLECLRLKRGVGFAAMWRRGGDRRTTDHRQQEPQREPQRSLVNGADRAAPPLSSSVS